jgi:hypothetical protein
LLYPPIARAAHVTGQIILMVQFAPDGSVHAAEVLSGPVMLRASAKTYVSGWLANRYGGSRTCPIVIGYQLDSSEENGKVERRDAQHYVVWGSAPCLCDPSGVIGKRRKFFGIF